MRVCSERCFGAFEFYSGPVYAQQQVLEARVVADGVCGRAVGGR